MTIKPLQPSIVAILGQLIGVDSDYIFWSWRRVASLLVFTTHCNHMAATMVDDTNIFSSAGRAASYPEFGPFTISPFSVLQLIRLQAVVFSLPGQLLLSI